VFYFDVGRSRVFNLKKKHKKKKVPHDSIVSGTRVEYFVASINKKFLLHSKQIVSVIDFQSLIAIFDLAFKDDAIDVEAAVQLYSIFYLKIKELERESDVCSVNNQISWEYIWAKGIECEALIQIAKQLIAKLIQHYKEESNVDKKLQSYANLLTVVEQILFACEEDATRHLLLAEYIHQEYYEDALTCYEVASSRNIILKMIEKATSDLMCENEAGKNLLSILQHKCLMYEIFSKLVLIEIKLPVNSVDAWTDCILLENMVESLEQHKIDSVLMKKYKRIKKRCDMLGQEDAQPTITVVDEQSTEKTYSLAFQSCQTNAMDGIDFSVDRTQTTPKQEQPHYASLLQYPVKQPQGRLHIFMPKPIAEVLHSIKITGYYALIVGGAVRDLLMGFPFPDVDIMTNMPSDRLLMHFSANNILQTRHISGLYQMQYAGIKFDITYCETNIFTSWQAFFTDARTRAFTINALYCDFYGNVHDPLQHGLRDLLYMPTLRLIQHDFCRFGQDPGLLLRSVRLIVKYELKISSELVGAMRYFSGSIKALDPYCLHIEIKRNFLRGYAVKTLVLFIHLHLFQNCYSKASLFLKSAQGESYEKWLYQELKHTDELVRNNKNPSIAYVYALFLTGEILATLNPSSEDVLLNITQNINQVVEQSLQKIFNAEYLNKIKKIMASYVRQFVSEASQVNTKKVLLTQKTQIPLEIAPLSHLIQYRSIPQVSPNISVVSKNVELTNKLPHSLMAM
jgi:tRNA nucleotidyltransferase/poly(A) polymerase